MPEQSLQSTAQGSRPGIKGVEGSANGSAGGWYHEVTVEEGGARQRGAQAAHDGRADGEIGDEVT
jgi:hypothetical protein